MRLTVLWLALMTSTASAQWPQWGGPTRDFNTDTDNLALTWPAEGPTELWRRPLGDGYSAILVDDGRLYTMYRANEDEVVVVLSPKTGKFLWMRRCPTPIDAGAHPSRYGIGPRSTPLIVADRLYTVGFNGTMNCFDKKTGKTIWSVELLKKYDGSRRRWGYACSPIAHKDTVIVFVGGSHGSIVAMDQHDGDTVWKRHDFQNAYASPILIDVDGQMQLICFMATHVAGLDPNNGDLLWQHPHENQWRNNIVTPVWGPGNLLFISSEGNGGGGVLRLQQSGGKATVNEVWHNRKTRLSHRNAIRIGDYIYASLGDFGPSIFAAVDVNTGRIAWKHRGFPAACAVRAGKRLIILDEDGHLMLATVTPQALTIHARAKVLQKEAWTIPTLVGNRLYLRDRKEIVALELPTKTEQ
jgi:outer membrane protein assembly factor BamB